MRKFFWQLSLALLLTSALGWGQQSCVSGQVLTSRQGFSALAAVVPSAQVAVAPGPIYTDQTGSTQAANPITADNYGNYQICATAGTTQTLTISGANLQVLTIRISFPIMTNSNVVWTGTHTFQGATLFLNVSGMTVASQITANGFIANGQVGQAFNAGPACAPGGTCSAQSITMTALNAGVQNTTAITTNPTGDVVVTPLLGRALIDNAGFQLAAIAAPAIPATGAEIYYDQSSTTVKLSVNQLSYFNITQTVGTGSVTTAGTAVGAGTCQAQTSIPITGAAVADSVIPNLNAARPASWQTGIGYSAEVTATNTVVVSLCNGTAGSITPVATPVNVRVIR